MYATQLTGRTLEFATQAMRHLDSAIVDLGEFAANPGVSGHVTAAAEKGYLAGELLLYTDARLAPAGDALISAYNALASSTPHEAAYTLRQSDAIAAIHSGARQLRAILG